MKKKSVFLHILIFLFSSSVIHGQAALLVLLFGEKVASENFYFSLKAGANYSTISNIDNANYDWGYNFGLGMNIKLNDKLFITPDFMPLSNKGVKNVAPLPTGNSDLDALFQEPSSTYRALNYLDIPILLKYYITPEICFSAGPQFSILMSAADTYEVDRGGEDFLRYENNIKDQLNTFDYGAAFELSYEISKARHGKGLRIHAKYALGMSDIVKDNSGDAFTNSVFQFGLSFPFISEKQREIEE